MRDTLERRASRPEPGGGVATRSRRRGGAEEALEAATVSGAAGVGAALAAALGAASTAASPAGALEREQATSAIAVAVLKNVALMA
jgi:hypothetical protein